MGDYKLQSFPRSRIATLDIGAVGKNKHHIAALLEVDVTAARAQLRRRKAEGRPLSFTAWLIWVIARTIKEHERVAAYLQGKRQVMIFADVNVSTLVEKEINGHKVPIPLVIEKAQERTVESITAQLREAQARPLTDKDIVLQRRSGALERFYYVLPGFLRRFFWRSLLRRPRQVFRKMGNVAFTSVGMMGRVNGWFIPISVHPVCFGVGRVTEKPVVVESEIVIREILNMTILADHDVIDGAPLARFIGELCERMEKGEGV